MRYGAGREVLRDITMRLAPGGFYFLTGPSGAGKSSLLKLIYLAERPSRGLISLFGRDLATPPRRELPALRRRIGVVFQDFRLLPHLSALRQRGAAAARRRPSRQPHRRQCGRTAALGRPRRGDRRQAGDLSGGQQQRVAIARAVVSKPSLLSPTSPPAMSTTSSRCGCCACSRSSTGKAPPSSSRPTTRGCSRAFAITRLHLENGELTVGALGASQ